MAKWNWGGAAVGLLGGVAAEAKAHEKRLHDLEDQRIADERETRRQEAIIAKQMAMAKYQADLQSARDDVNWGRRKESEREQRTYQDESDMRKMEAAHDYNVRLQQMKDDAAAEKGGTLKQSYNDLIDIGFSEEEAKKLTTKEERGSLSDKEARRLYNEAYTKALTAEKQGVISMNPDQQRAAELKAHRFAAQLTGFDLYGVLDKPQGLLSGAGSQGGAPLPMPKKKEEMVEGQTYMTRHGPAVWRNGAFHTR